MIARVNLRAYGADAFHCHRSLTRQTWESAAAARDRATSSATPRARPAGLDSSGPVGRRGAYCAQAFPRERKTQMSRRLLQLTLLALTTTCFWPAAAQADGLPVLGVDTSPSGVAALQAPLRYVALGSGSSTVVARIERNGGRVPGSVALRGRFAIPAVAFDGSAGGLSADGRTLVLLRPRLRFPQRRTTFAILDARRLRVRTTVTLRGDFSFDAISPDGSRLYLIQYLSPRDVNRYSVRTYDVATERLLVRPVVDPSERGPAMRGYPLTRATSPDGRWAYTLYDGAGTHPFVHALDTATGA